MLNNALRLPHWIISSRGVVEPRFNVEQCGTYFPRKCRGALKMAQFLQHKPDQCSNSSLFSHEYANKSLIFEIVGRRLVTITTSRKFCIIGLRDCSLWYDVRGHLQGQRYVPAQIARHSPFAMFYTQLVRAPLSHVPPP